jgi:hypothetical protein
MGGYFRGVKGNFPNIKEVTISQTTNLKNTISNN